MKDLRATPYMKPGDFLPNPLINAKRAHLTLVFVFQAEFNDINLNINNSSIVSVAGWGRETCFQIWPLSYYQPKKKLKKQRNPFPQILLNYKEVDEFS